MSPTSRAWLQIHACVLLWGFTGILGRAISMEALPLVWWRMVIVTGVLLLVRRFWRGVIALRPASMAIFAGTGVLLSLHWVTFYASIKLANASVAATCMALTPVIIALIEPLIARRPFDVRELLFGLAVIPGVALVAGGTPSGMRLGVGVGVLSAAFIAVVSCLHKRFAAEASALAVTGIEMAAGVVFLPLLGPVLGGETSMFTPPGQTDVLFLLALAFGCTLLPYVLSLVALRQLSAFASALAVNLEPVYTIVLAMVFFSEQHELSLSFYAGAAVLVGVVFSHPLLARPNAAATPNAPA